MNDQDNTHVIEDLFTYLGTLRNYPNGTIKIPGRILGTAFFPGGSGLWNTQPNHALPSMPFGGVMVIGNNFDSEAGFEYSFNHLGEDLNGATWRNLLAFLKEVKIPPEECFFTNAYVGLVAGNSATGLFPGARSPDFVRWCQNFLLYQLRLMKPRLILSLGIYVPRFMAPLSPALNSSWSDITSFKVLDKRGVALVYPTTFIGLSHPIAVVALTHPCYRPVNVRFRRYGNLEGDAAEQALVRDALAMVGYE
jgi:uracil-DNA glycosylase